MALGAVEVKLASYDQAIQHYRQALDTIEGLRAGLGSKESKSTYMKNKLFVYDELIELLRSLHEKDPAKGYDREALEIFERKQGRLFLEEMGQSGARNFAGLPEQVRSQETELENRLDKLQAALVKERSQPQPDQARLQTLETELQQARAAFQTLKVETPNQATPTTMPSNILNPPSWLNSRPRSCKPGEVMLVYGVMKDKTCLWVIGQRGLSAAYLTHRGEGPGPEDCRLPAPGPEGRGRGRKAAAGPRTRPAKELDQLRHELYSLLFPAPVGAALSPGNRPVYHPHRPLILPALRGPGDPGSRVSRPTIWWRIMPSPTCPRPRS